jgi:hypothetical protein
MKAVTIAIIFFLSASASNAQQYKVTGKKIAGWSALAFSGAVDGIVEGWEFDGRAKFEQWGASKTGYFGSESWRSVYVGGDPALGFKSDFHRLAGAQDFYHHADDIRKMGYITGGIIIGIGGHRVNSKWWHYAIDVGASLALSGISKAGGMYLIRR